MAMPDVSQGFRCVEEIVYKASKQLTVSHKQNLKWSGGAHMHLHIHHFQVGVLMEAV